MSNVAGYIFTGVVVAIAAIIAYYTSKSDPEPPMSYSRRQSGTGKKKSRSPTPPPSPLTSELTSKSRRRRKSSHNCTNCGENPFVKISPCNHESICVRCDADYLKNNDTCPVCSGRIDSCYPPIPYFGKCGDCRKFTELFEILPCNHSLSLCISCFERKDISYKKCPICKETIRGYKPECSTSGLCIVCNEFTVFAKFKPCGHGRFCRKHAEQYLKNSDHECSECGKIVEI